MLESLSFDNLQATHYLFVIKERSQFSFHVRHHQVLLPSHVHLHHPNLLGNTDNTASGTSASVASLLALLVAAFAKVVGAGVDNDGAAEDALGADQLDVLVRDGALGVALGVGLEVAQVADVALAVGGGAVGLVVWVDWWEEGGVSWLLVGWERVGGRMSSGSLSLQ